MRTIAQRIAESIRRLGDAVTIGGVAHYGIATLPQRSGVLLLPNEYDGVGRPFRALYVAGNVTVSAGVTATLHGLPWTIQRAIPLTVRNEVVARLLVLTR
ncbi:MAG: hypothetical protein SFX74_03125 [Fimbriimonadaceae bacterium]|nr:hypothetical protein [Fimbriimonadaceae bacterium]